MSYNLLYTRTAVSDIQKLDKVAKKRIKRKIEEYVHDPLLHAKRLIDSRIGTYRWRIGNYRVIFDLDSKIIIILRIRHRREIYKK